MNELIVCVCLSLGAGRAPEPDRLFGEDKLKHFFTSFVATSLASSAAWMAGADREASLYVGAGAGFGIGIAKELRDRDQASETASFLDLAWDAAGVGAGIALAAQAR